MHAAHSPTQLGLFDSARAAPRTRREKGDPPRARRDDPATSRLAAASAGATARVHHAKILEALDQADGTIYELAARTGLTHVQVARRMPELEECRRARTTDETRPSPGGYPCRVWARSS